jgi:hypothetical protein
LHRLVFRPGTRRARRADNTRVDQRGGREDIELEPVLCYRMKGIGYGHPEWGHGKWKGELAIGGESWKCDQVDENDFPNLHIQQVVMAKSGDRRGVGVLEQIHLGPHARYGWKDLVGPG